MWFCFTYLNGVSMFVLTHRQAKRIVFQPRVEAVANDLETKQSCINIQASDSQCMVMAEIVLHAQRTRLLRECMKTKHEHGRMIQRTKTHYHNIDASRSLLNSNLFVNPSGTVFHPGPIIALPGVKKNSGLPSCKNRS